MCKISGSCRKVIHGPACTSCAVCKVLCPLGTTVGILVWLLGILVGILCLPEFVFLSLIWFMKYDACLRAVIFEFEYTNM